MRRRGDSFVNATQILKVAGVDKGRRTKILEKEILPGKHEIVQGGYGKYQGTWYVSIGLTLSLPSVLLLFWS
jgi:regulatory protein SWI6